MRTHAIRFALVIVFVCPVASAQWVNTNVPKTFLRAFAGSGHNLFASTDHDGVFLSTNDGTNWRAANTPFSAFSCMALYDSILFAGTWFGIVFLSTNNGTSWTAAGLTDTRVWSVAVSGTNLFAGTGDGVFLSTDHGKRWTPANDGLPKSEYDTTRYVDVLCFAVSDTNIFTGTTGGVFRSTDNGTSWSATGLTNGVSCLAVSGTNLFAGTGGVYLSTDNGTSWTDVNPGLTNTWVKALAVSGTNLFAATPGKSGDVLISTNGGTNWNSTGLWDGWSDFIDCGLALSDKYLFAFNTEGVWRRPLSEMITDVESSRFLPESFLLEQNYPNPFNPSTTIKYELPKSSDVRLSVYDVLGREVSVLVNERRNVGVHEVKFDGSTLASGVYFYRLQAGDFVSSKRMLILK